MSLAARGPVDPTKERPGGGSSKRETRKRQINESRQNKLPVTPIMTNGSRRRCVIGDIGQPPASPISAPREGDVMLGAEEKTKPKTRPLSPVSRAIDMLGAEEKTKPKIRPLSPVSRAIDSSPIIVAKQAANEFEQSPDPKRRAGASTKRDIRRRQTLDSKLKKRPVTPVAVPIARRIQKTSSGGDVDDLPPTSPTSKRELLMIRHSSEDRNKFKKRLMAAPSRVIENSPITIPKQVSKEVEQSPDPKRAPGAGNIAKRPVSSVGRVVEKSPTTATFKSPVVTSQSPSTSTSLPRVASVKISPKGSISSSRRARKFTRPYDFMKPPATPGVMDRRRDLGRLVKTAPIPDAVRRSRLLQPR